MKNTNKALDLEFEPSIFFGEGRSIGTIMEGTSREYTTDQEDGLIHQLMEWSDGLPSEFGYNEHVAQELRSQASNSLIQQKQQKVYQVKPWKNLNGIFKTKEHILKMIWSVNPILKAQIMLTIIITFYHPLKK